MKTTKVNLRSQWRQLIKNIEVMEYFPGRISLHFYLYKYVYNQLLRVKNERICALLSELENLSRQNDTDSWKNASQNTEIIQDNDLFQAREFKEVICPESLSYLFEQLCINKKGSSKRANRGIFLTPPHLAKMMAELSIEDHVLQKSNKILECDWESLNDLLDNANRDQISIILDEVVKKITILDPAVGSGEFLAASGEKLISLNVELHSRLGEEINRLEIARYIVNHNLHGVDLEKTAVIACCLRLYLFVVNNTKEDRENAIIPQVRLDLIKHGNSLFGMNFNQKNEEGIPNYQDNTFHWSDEFPSVNKSGGFDIVISNPPWGSRFRGAKIDSLSKKKLGIIYPAWGNNVYGAFITRFLCRGGLLGSSGSGCFLLPDTFLTIRSFHQLRKKLLEQQILNIITLGDGVFADAPAMSCMVLHVRNEDPSEGHVVNIIDQDSQNELERVKLFKIQQNQWKTIRKNRFIYAVPPAILEYFHEYSAVKTLSPFLAEIKQGLATGNNRKFVRHLKEVPRDQIGINDSDFCENGKKWAFFAMGRYLKPYKLDIEKCVYWENNGEAIKSQRHPVTGKRRARVQNSKYYFRSGGICFKSLGKGNFCAAYLPEGCIFGHTAHTIFLHDPDPLIGHFILAYLNSKVGRFFIDKCINSGKHAEVGDVSELPVILPGKKDLVVINQLVNKAIDASSESNLLLLNEIQSKIDEMMFKVFNLENDVLSRSP
ncbi:MAG: Eco57I restriction-modification methylase domain-containing protein [Candidatus Hodarchaeales archaeon]